MENIVFGDITKDLLLDTIDRVVKRTFATDYTWDWPAGVAMYGVARAWEATGKTEYADMAAKWIESHEEVGIPAFTINRIAVGHVLVSLYELTKEQKYLDLILKKAEYLTHDALRFAEGCFQHTVSLNNDFPEQAWADTLFMAGYFLARVGTLLDNKDYAQDALNQFKWHIEYLQNMKTGLFYHAYNNIDKSNMSALPWARANAWVALTIGETCKLKIANPFDPITPELWGARDDQLAALVRLQAEDGMWHTVLTEPSTYTETSAACGIGVGLVLSKNPLYKKYSDKALVGVLNKIDETGAVLGVSGGTAVMHDIEGYANITTRRVQGWGQGLALAFLVAKLKDFE